MLFNEVLIYALCTYSLEFLFFLFYVVEDNMNFAKIILNLNSTGMVGLAKIEGEMELPKVADGWHPASINHHHHHHPTKPLLLSPLFPILLAPWATNWATNITAVSFSLSFPFRRKRWVVSCEVLHLHHYHHHLSSESRRIHAQCFLLSLWKDSISNWGSNIGRYL